MKRISSPSSRWRSSRNPLLLGGLAVFLLCSTAWAQLTVLPTAGKSVGTVTAPESGKWLVFGPNSIKFIQPTVLEGGKVCVFEGLAGEYAVVFLPPAADSQPLVANVTLGGTAPGPNPDPPKPPIPGGLKQVMLLYRMSDLDNLPEGQQEILSSLSLREWIRAQGHVPLGLVDFARPGAGSLPERYQKWQEAWKKAGSPALAIGTAPKEGGTIEIQSLPATAEEVKQLLGAKP